MAVKAKSKLIQMIAKCKNEDEMKSKDLSAKEAKKGKKKLHSAFKGIKPDKK